MQTVNTEGFEEKDVIDVACGKRIGCVTALEFEGERFDLGSKVGFLKANVVAGVSHPETGEEFRAFLKQFVSEMDR